MPSGAPAKLLPVWSDFPKGANFSKITDEQAAKVESRINNRPGKCLGYETPRKVASVFVALRP